MAYDEAVAARIRKALAHRTDVVEKKMFGGLAFMVAGHMCVGVTGSEMMARVGPEQHEAALARPHARPMDFTGRPMKGFLYVAAPGFAKEPDLRSWISTCESFVATLPPK
jgi:hypothetical protein